ncbi:MAG TPA: rubredoxin [Candidatus Scatomorpha gallistercoris]|nr:rubredoxin [Candidatus Scatomorpha gallistercoris]
MLKYICEHCGFVFDEDEFIPGMGLPEGSGFYDLPDDWSCPLCGAAKDDFLPSE